MRLLLRAFSIRLMQFWAEQRRLTAQSELIWSRKVCKSQQTLKHKKKRRLGILFYLEQFAGFAIAETLLYMAAKVLDEVAKGLLEQRLLALGNGGHTLEQSHGIPLDVFLLYLWSIVGEKVQANPQGSVQKVFLF